MNCDQIDDAAAEAERAEQERLEEVIEAEQCALVDAADAIAALILGDWDAEVALSELNHELSKIKKPVFFSRSLIEGLNQLKKSVCDSNGRTQRLYLLAMIGAMALVDPTKDARTPGQIEHQAAECLKALDKS